MSSEMGVWRAILKFVNTIPRPNTMKRWSGMKIVSATLLMFMMLLALTRMNRERHTFTRDAESLTIDHRTLLSQRFEALEAASRIEGEGQNVTTPIIPAVAEPLKEEDKPNLVADSIPPPPVVRTGQRTFQAPLRTPLNERAHPDWLLHEYYPIEMYFHTVLKGAQPKSEISPWAPKYDNKIPLKKVLILQEEVKASKKRSMEELFGPLRIDAEFHQLNDIPPLVIRNLNVPMYSLIVFANYDLYLGMAKETRSVLDDYCRIYGVGILGFATSNTTSAPDVAAASSSEEFKLSIQHDMKLNQLKLNAQVSQFWRVAKPEMVFQDAIPDPFSKWSVFVAGHPTYEPLAFSTVSKEFMGTANVSRVEFGVATALRDKGELDGIRRVLLGNDPDFFLNMIIAMDGIGWLTHGRLELPLERIVQIDVDDMFVGVSAVRTRPKDAEAMVECNRRIRQYVPNFRLFLGFTGAMIFWGDDEVDKAEQMMVDYAHQFIWFNHLYRHELLYITPIDRISGAMSKNLKWAEEKGLPLIKEYMILPHHAGVYPVYPEVFDEWESIGYVKATSTLEYPYRHPQWGRRGFVHRGVKILPRQTCRLFTKTITFDIYGGNKVDGKAAMDESINGGYIFKIYLTTPVMVFMTHMSNYATENLAQYQFEGVAKAIATWTNLKMVAPHPMDVADDYFHLYPDEKDPLWSDPVRDPNMKELMRVNATLPVFPNVLIVGPQKTGTTALLTFLKLHPNLMSSKQDPVLFEEVQFFSSVNYHKGIDWYAARFPVKKNNKTILFEKSAPYFSHYKTPQRAKELIPDAKIIMIMNNPMKRAYSWYQHLKAHNSTLTQQYSFHQVVTAPDNSPPELLEARKRHLYEGQYAIHLARWLLFYPIEQIALIDGDLLKTDPITVMNDLQNFLGVSPKIKYEDKIEYDEEKGFYCVKETGCLGQSKGRQYDKMDDETETFLKGYFKNSNEDLKIILDSLSYKHPSWLANF